LLCRFNCRLHIHLPPSFQTVLPAFSGRARASSKVAPKLRSAQRRRQRQGQHHRQGHRHRQRQRRQDKAWEVAGIVLDVPYIIRRLRSSRAIYYI
jgi:hypothetical protein